MGNANGLSHARDYNISHLFLTRNINIDDLMSSCGTWSINWTFIFIGAVFALPFSSPTWNEDIKSYQAMQTPSSSMWESRANNVGLAFKDNQVKQIEELTHREAQPRRTSES